MDSRVVLLALSLAICKGASIQQPAANVQRSSDWKPTCYVNGQELQPGQRTKTDSFVYECQYDGQLVRTTIVACIDDSQKERQLNEEWVEGEKPYKFVLECVKKDGGITSRRVKQCFYDSDEGQAKIDPGQEQTVGNARVRCDRSGTNGVQYSVTYTNLDNSNPAKYAVVNKGNNVVSKPQEVSANPNTNASVSLSTNADGSVSVQNVGNSSSGSSPAGSTSGSNSGSSSTGATSTGSSSTSGSSPSSSSNANTNSNPAPIPASANAPPQRSFNWSPKCYIDGREVQPGQRGRTGSFVYECQWDGQLVRTAIVACLDDNKNERQLNERWEEGQKPFKFIMECSKDKDVTSIRVAQCYYDSDEGQAKVDPGSEQTVGKTTIRCERSSTGGVRYRVLYADARNAPSGSQTQGQTQTQTQPQSNANPNPSSSSGSSPNSGSSSSSGSNSNTNVKYNSNTLTLGVKLPNTCVVNGQDLQPGQRARARSFVYECQPSGKSARAVIVACLDANNVEHPLNERWTEGDRPFRYVFECVKTDGVTQKRVAQCFYDGDEGQAKLDMGQQQQVGDKIVGCERAGEGGAQWKVQYQVKSIANTGR